MEKIEVEVVGLSANAGRNGAFALILKEIDGWRRLPILIGSFEAQAIALPLEGTKPPRPLPHDLIKSFCDNLGATVVEVFIDELKDSTFYAKITLEYSSLTTEIDSRPSDAIALAVRTGAPIFVSSDVMDLAAYKPSDVPDYLEQNNENDEDEGSDFNFDITENKKDNQNEETTKENINIAHESQLAQLQDQLRQAIEKEDYERAAKLRDEINKISNPNS
ncbi:MAG TPA: bifunctional nuclease family protein [Melioribacteraceae bacterium]|nr:bifunctional nuclease family protein [Melioribacteraceae bacterium]